MSFLLKFDDVNLRLVTLTLLGLGLRYWFRTRLRNFVLTRPTKGGVFNYVILLDILSIILFLPSK